jgi:outer membrane protein assembly factor BamB
MITMTQKAAVGIDVATGRLLWSHPHGRYGQNTTTPVYHDGHVLIACGHSAGGTLLRIAPDSRSVTQVWHKREFDNCHGGILLLGGHAYGCGCRLGGKGFFSVDFLTGETRQTDRTLGKVSITYADGMIYGLDDKRAMSLLAVKPGGFEIVSRFELPDLGEGPSLSHVVVCGGRLYVRHDQYLYVYDVKAP